MSAPVNTRYLFDKPIVTRRNLLSTAAGAATLVAATPALAVLEIDITRGNIDPLPIAVTDLFSDDSSAAIRGNEISSVVAADLERSGLFRPLRKETFIQKPEEMQPRPRFVDWRTINAQALVTGRSSLGEDGLMRVEFRLWDVFAEQQMTGLVFTSAPESWRRVSHLIADQIYERLTGEKGYFDTRIVYVSERGRPNDRKKRLAIMDQDGANHTYLTDESFLVLTPRFSPTSQEITYLSYEHNQARVYIYNIDTGQRELLGDFPGMSYAPRFHPDGRQVIITVSESGNSDIYTMNLQTREMSPNLTENSALDTSPSYSPDGDYIAFTSDRGGSPQIYTMKANGKEQRRISFDPDPDQRRNSSYSTPVWSPRGDLIAFTKQYKRLFAIGVMRADGSDERILATTTEPGKGLIEGPTWAPNGRVLMYFSKEPTTNLGGGDVFLRSVDLTGHNDRLVETPYLGSDPAWSPPL